MAETLLSLSEVLLFGREVEDLQIRRLLESDGAGADHRVTVATTVHVPELKGHPTIDGKKLAVGDTVLVRRQAHAHLDEEDIYTVGAANAAWTRVKVASGKTVFVENGNKNKGKSWIRSDSGKHRFKPAGKRKELGKNKQLGSQLDENARFARIYGFSYEGAYYDLPYPTLFLVHGDGDSVTDENAPPGQFSRAPTEPSQSGVAIADFQFADDIRVWAYDKADYTIRMDVETGMFEQVLLDIAFDGGGPGGVAGANVRGANVRGANVRGANVRGANVRGANVRGANVRGGGGGD